MPTLLPLQFTCGLQLWQQLAPAWGWKSCWFKWRWRIGVVVLCLQSSSTSFTWRPLALLGNTAALTFAANWEELEVLKQYCSCWRSLACVKRLHCHKLWSIFQCWKSPHFPHKKVWALTWATKVHILFSCRRAGIQKGRWTRYIPLGRGIAS